MIPIVEWPSRSLMACKRAGSGQVAKPLANSVSYFPYPLKMWVNGHEWAKRRAAADGLAFTELANGFATCQDPVRLQAMCDWLNPAKIAGLLQLLDRLHPLPVHTRRRKPHVYRTDHRA